MAKRYCGKGWVKDFENGGSVINLSLTQAELNKLKPDQYGNIFVVVSTRSEVDPKSKATHSVYVDDYRHKD